MLFYCSTTFYSGCAPADTLGSGMVEIPGRGLAIGVVVACY